MVWCCCLCFFHKRIFVSISRENHYKLSGKEKRSDLHISVAASCIELAFTGCLSWPTHLVSFFNEWCSECVNARILSFCILGSVRQSREPMKMEFSWIFRASLAECHKMGHLDSQIMHKFILGVWTPKDAIPNARTMHTDSSAPSTSSGFKPANPKEDRSLLQHVLKIREPISGNLRPLTNDGYLKKMKSVI